MEKDKIRKKSNKKLNNQLRHKADRSTKVEGVLATKIQQSIERAKFVQTTRKAGWDQINRTLTISSSASDKEKKLAVEQAEEDMDREAEDQYVKDFYGDSEANMTDDVGVPEKPTTDVLEKLKSTNRFALLETEDE
ncbi:hypothetical protein PUMCH_003400 [Australozyma saopauloensis]|uniref:Uncharacterized protein n=1 Tax=Australozyma saopauloensis TaxID=291208 RepID=A0AAX4HEB5_9ASCO|nr:hypothetical protein PUMCH_003400 [[Candida] saopauloensis]